MLDRGTKLHEAVIPDRKAGRSSTVMRFINIDSIFMSSPLGQRAPTLRPHRDGLRKG